jgi:hypothetical protein
VLGILGVIGSGAVVVGSMCLIVGISIFLLLGIDELLGRNVLRRTPARTPAQLKTAERLPRRVAVIGQAAPGARGMLTAPLSQRDCVWYRLSLWCETRHEDGWRDTMVSVYRSDDVIRLEQEDGSVLVSADLLGEKLPGATGSPMESPWAELRADPAIEDPSGFDQLRKLGLIPPQALAAGTRPRGFSAEEELIAAGQPLVVLGAPRRDDSGVRLVRHTLGRSGVARDQQLLSQAEAQARDTLSLVRGLTKFGLVLLVGGMALIFLVAAISG